MRLRTGFCFLTFLLLINTALAFDRTLFNTTIHPHEGFYSTELSFNLPEGSNIMQTFLLPCNIDDDISCVSIKQCDSSCPPQEGILLDEREISGTGEIDLSFSSEPGLYKICSRLKQEPFYYDCWPDKYFFLMDKEVVVQTKPKYIYKNITQYIEKKEPFVNIYSVPTKITVQENFQTTVFFNNPGNENLSAKAYTFSFHEGECITQNCWNDFIEIELLPNSWEQVIFNNSFNEFGNFTFKARMKSGNKSYTDMMKIHVIPKRELQSQFIYNDSHVGYSLKNNGDIGENLNIAIIKKNTTHINLSLEPGEQKSSFFQRFDGWMYLFNEKELLDSRQIWEYEEKQDPGPTGFFVANPNDLNIPFVLVSLVTLGMIVWKI